MLRTCLLALGVYVFLIGNAHGAGDAPERKQAIILGNASPEAAKVLSEFGFSLRATPELPHAKESDIAEKVLAEVRLHLQRVEAAFHSGRVEDGLASLARAKEGLHALWDRGFEEAVAAKLWRSGLAQASGDRTTAQTAIVEALIMDPDLSIDLNRFWPSLADAVEAQRAQGQSVLLRMGTLPPGSEIFVDRRIVPAEATVRRGQHRIMVRAPRHSIVTREVVVESNMVFSLVPQVLHAEYADTLSSEDASERCDELRIDVCLFVGGYGAVLVELRSGPAVVHRTDRKGDLGAWLRTSLQSPKESPKESSLGNWELNAGLVFGGLRGMEISWGQSSLAMETESSGIAGGAMWHADPEGSGLFAGGALSVQRTFEGTLRSTNVTSEIPRRVPSSLHLYGQGQLGYKSQLRKRFWVSPYLSTELYSTRFRDPSDDDGPLRVFAPLTFVSLALGLRLEAAVADRISLGLDLRFSALGITLESPDSLGGEGDPGLVAFGADIGWHYSKNLRVVFALLVHQSPLRLSGQGSTRVIPQVEDADIDLVSGEGTLKLYWRWSQ